MGIDKVDVIRAVFLDRDGVLNRNVFNPATGEYESPGKPEDFELFPNVMPTLHRLQDAGYTLLLVSNQPNYAKGKNSLEELHAVQALLAKQLDQAGIHFADFYYCFHHPKGIVPSHSGPCECRKPSTFFLEKAQAEFGISMPHSWMVGDRATDIECGQNAGVRTIRVKGDHPTVRAADEAVATFEADDLAHAVLLILAAPDRL
jgi:D-glycero-D-manno-heptose 1,7-bisphosphate phosphatase